MIAMAYVNGELVSYRKVRRGIARRFRRPGSQVRLSRMAGGTVRLHSPEGQPWALPWWECRTDHEKSP
jgi:hypothetical protein